MTECNGCGRCCDPVVLPFSQTDAARLLPEDGIDPVNRRFILDSLIPISRREGRQETSYLPTGVSNVILGGRPQVMYSYFYRCMHYDRETRTCGIYDRRPPLCRGFPWYGDAPDEDKPLPEECSYNADVGRPVAVAPPRRVR